MFPERGFMTWLFWRSAYLTKLVSRKNKLLVAEDWLRTHIFGRDISRFLELMGPSLMRVEPMPPSRYRRFS